MSQKMVSAREYKGVQEVANKYIEALRLGKPEMLADLFHKDSVTYGTVDGALVGGGSSNPAVDFIRTHGKSSEIIAHIDVLDISPTTATVRIVTERDAVGSECAENLLLIKLETGWRIMAKVFHQF